MTLRLTPSHLAQLKLDVLAHRPSPVRVFAERSVAGVLVCFLPLSQISRHTADILTEASAVRSE